MKTTVVAEPGSTHDGDLDAMYRLIDVAAEAGVDVVKFQWTSSAVELATQRNAHRYIPAYKLIEFPSAWLSLLRTHCEASGVAFACTGYLVKDLDVLAADVSCFKVASFESQSEHFLEAHLRFDKPMIVSTGMADPGMLRRLRGFRARFRPGYVQLLHCISAYPAPIADLQLHAIRSECLDGFSDHTGKPTTGALAVAAGARIVEVHCRLNEADPKNADFGHSLSPERLRKYVSLIRMAELMLGDHLPRFPAPSEAPMLAYRSP